MAEFIEEKYTDEYEVLTPNGWEDFKGIGKTIKYDEYEVIFNNKKSIICADDHIFMYGDIEKLCKELQVGDIISSKDGDISVESIIPLNNQSNMYDLIDVNGSVYYTNDIISHNSLSVGVYVLWYSIFNSDKVIGIVSNKESSAIDFLSRIKIMYEELPGFLKPGVMEYNKKQCIFENGTYIVAGATSKSAFRGKTANIIISDELAFVEGDKADDFYMSNYPTLSVSKYGKFIAISTPNGVGGLFYELYRGAEKGTNGYKHFYANYQSHPDRGGDWGKKMEEKIGQRRFSQEHRCDFLGSANTIIDRDILIRLTSQDSVPYTLTLKDRMRVYEKPIQGAQYLIACDPSKGTGEHDACIQIMKLNSISPISMTQVAVFQDNHTDTYELSNILHQLSFYYDNSYIICENNGEGSAVISTLWWDLENESLLNEGNKASKLGIRATTKSKPRTVLLMKKLIEDGSIELVDDNTIAQLTTFIDKGNNKFTGNGSPDDLVSALYWSPWIFTMDILDESITFKKDKDESDEWSIFTDKDLDVQEGYEMIKRY